MFQLLLMAANAAFIGPVRKRTGPGPGSRCSGGWQVEIRKSSPLCSCHMRSPQLAVKWYTNCDVRGSMQRISRPSCIQIRPSLSRKGTPWLPLVPKVRASSGAGTSVPSRSSNSADPPWKKFASTRCASHCAKPRTNQELGSHGRPCPGIMRPTLIRCGAILNTPFPSVPTQVLPCRSKAMAVMFKGRCSGSNKG